MAGHEVQSSGAWDVEDVVEYVVLPTVGVLVLATAILLVAGRLGAFNNFMQPGMSAHVSGGRIYFRRHGRRQEPPDGISD